MNNYPSSITASSEEMYFKDNTIIYIWSIATLIVVMNTTMFNLALPNILSDFQLSSSTASWLISGYSIMFAISTLTFSRLSDFISMKKLIVFGILLLAVASVIGFFANNFYMLLFARVAQAAGSGVITGLNMIITGKYIPFERRGKAMAMIASSASLAFGLGPLLGGVVTDIFGWNYILLIGVLTIIFIPILFKLLPDPPDTEGNFDYLGAFLTGASITIFLLFLNTLSIPLLILAVLLFFSWWIYLNKRRFPFIPPVLLRNAHYMRLVIIGNLAFFLNFSNLFIMPLLISDVFGRKPIEIGLFIFPGAFVSVIAGQFIGRWIDHYGAKPMLLLGNCLLLVGSTLFMLFATVSPYYMLFIYMFSSIGFTAITSSNSNEITRILPFDQIASGIGINNLLTFIGGGFGVTVTGILLSLQDHLPITTIYRNTYLFYVFVTAVSLVILFIYLRKLRNIEQPAAQTVNE